MTKKRLFIGLLSLAVAISCLIIVTSNASQLPPDVAKPNSKPALSANHEKSTLSVNNKPAQTADLAVSKPDAGKTTELSTSADTQADSTNCDTTGTKKSTDLTTVTKPQKQTLVQLGDQLVQTVDSASSLQLPKTSSLLGL